MHKLLYNTSEKEETATVSEPWTQGHAVTVILMLSKSSLTLCAAKYPTTLSCHVQDALSLYKYMPSFLSFGLAIMRWNTMHEYSKPFKSW